MNVTVVGHGPDLTAHEALSGVFGSISLASWIFLLVSRHTPDSSAQYAARLPGTCIHVDDSSTRSPAHTRP